MADLEMARYRAAECLKRLNLTSPPVDAEPVARLQKVRVLFASFNAEARAQVSAYSEPPRVIYVNRDQPPEHKNYAIAHELGHLLLHPSYVNSDAYKVLLIDASIGTASSDPEKEAEAFAAELLVPRKFLASYRRGVNPEDLVSRFVAPVELIRAQLAAAGP